METSKLNQTITFFKEISLMMYGFGDSHEPNPETVCLVESIVLRQLRTIIEESIKYWDGKMLTGENLIFLLRHNKIKMQRLIKYLHNKILKNKLKRLQSNSETVDLDEIPKNNLLEFIEELDETGEFMDTSYVDEVKLRREIRADRITQALDEEKYLEFHKARCTSFKNANGDLKHLKLWVDPENLIAFNQDALDILSYYAFQTVAEIVDYALLVRADTKSTTDPFKHLQGSYYSSVMFNGTPRFEGLDLDYSSVHLNQPPISVNEIKEVMRRLHTPQAGKLNFGIKFPNTHYLFAL
ncbi:transcription initiation protein SPT3 homolog [Cylas formicarius]|uniref:transcription initiation protein SPT3 homolog n=1 Tax=Cylas formicarius TaxID=197179 RepID=UPI0029589461|nr:transcription initiation protein SPT3 homolog [Cylas formicarius]